MQAERPAHFWDVKHGFPPFALTAMIGICTTIIAK
jgi:hypothetical protein